MKSLTGRGRRTGPDRKPPQRGALSALVRPLSLPADAPGGEVRFTIYSDARAFIENHSGIIEFDGEHVRIAARRITLTIRGSGLTLDCCEGQALIIEGRIQGAELETRGGGA